MIFCTYSHVAITFPFLALYIILPSVSIVFEDKPFLEEDKLFAVNLFEGVPPFLLSQILGLPMDQWKGIEAANLKDRNKQLGSVLLSWNRSGPVAKWSVLIETLTELGLRGKAQTVCFEKGITTVPNCKTFSIQCNYTVPCAGMPTPKVNEDGPVWHSMKETLLKGVSKHHLFSVCT